MSKQNNYDFSDLINSKEFLDIRNKCVEDPLFSHRQVDPLIRLMREYSIAATDLTLVPEIAENLGVNPKDIIHSDNSLNHYEILATHPEEHANYGTPRVIGGRVPKAIRDRANSVHRRPEVKSFRISGENIFVGFHLDTPMLARVEKETVYGISQALPKSYQFLNFSGGLPSEVFNSIALEVENAVFIGDSFAFWNYAHWTLDWFPRLKWIQEHCDFSKLAIVFNKKPTQFNIAMLERIGFRQENIISPDVHSPTFFVKAKTVYTTNLACEYRHSCQVGAEWSINFLRDSFLAKKQSAFDYGLRVVIMRNQRGVTFSEVVQRDLERRGFIFVRMHLLDHNTQVEIFSNASVIIASHGAGLSNLAFCRPGTKVLELFNNILSTHAFYTVAHFGGLSYSCAVTDTLKPARSGESIYDDCHLDAATYFQWVDAVDL